MTLRYRRRYALVPVLSRLQQNAIFDAAKEAGLDPLDFRLRKEDQAHRGETEVFTHGPTQSRFDISLAHEGKTWCQWWPAFPPSHFYAQSGERACSVFSDSWDQVMRLVHSWAEEVKRNHGAPDLWAEAAKVRQMTDAASEPGADNSPFDPGEIALLKPKLDEIEAYITSQHALDAGQKKKLHGRFQYVLGAAKRGIGRVDWLNIFASQIFQMVWDNLIPSSLYGDVMRHAATAIGTLLKLGSKLLSS